MDVEKIVIVHVTAIYIHISQNTSVIVVEETSPVLSIFSLKFLPSQMSPFLYPASILTCLCTCPLSPNSYSLTCLPPLCPLMSPPSPTLFLITSVLSPLSPVSFPLSPSPLTSCKSHVHLAMYYLFSSICAL